jgi:uncharacterized NAD(P)/FAD-binding protein YdhS
VTGLDVAIVGTGPRGLSVLERLVARLAERPTPARVRIWAFDPGEHGAGRIWRTDQPDWFLMNTVAGEVTMYSGGPDDGPPRAGAGPSLHQWLSGHPDHRWPTGENDYVPRSGYGGYLRAVYDSVVANRPDNVVVRPVRAEVERVERHRGRFLVTAAGGRVRLAVDKVVLSTGHPVTAPDRRERELIGYAQRHAGLRYVPGGPAADMDLSPVRAGTPVGVVGLGLTFFDVVRVLTTGRGGRFEAGAGDTLRYRPSGHEPRVFAGSRGGLPLLARGANEKAPGYRYRPRFCTEPALADARRRSGDGRLDFRRDVLPLLCAEVDHVYYTALVRQRRGPRAADRFAARHLGGGDPRLLAEFGLAAEPGVDLDRLARPFAGLRFADPAHFHRHVLGLLEADVAQARHGNVSGPLKAALDTLRDLRGVVRAAVEFGGLCPDSHRDDFAGWFVPVNALLSTGPGRLRIAELHALVRAGVVGLVGPGTRVDPEPDGTGFALWSPQVGRSRRVVSTLVDARMPAPSVRRDLSPLVRQLLADGLITEDPVVGGGVSVTRAPFHAIGADGTPDPDLYPLGVPTEGPRWFTQIGNGRPGPMSGFHADADAVAADVLAGPPARLVARVPAPRGRLVHSGGSGWTTT